MDPNQQPPIAQPEIQSQTTTHLNSQQLVNTTPPSSYNRIKLIVIFFFLVILGTGVYYWGMRKNSLVSQNQQIAISPTITQSPINKLVSDPKQVLLPYIPNFDHLTISDLPNFTDVRGVYPYNGNLIVTGIDRIVEYNPSQKALVRVIDTNKLDSVYSTAVIGENLYVVSVPGLLSKGKSWNDSWARIYRIDLNTGKITKQYFGDPSKDKKYINLSITSKDDYIWASSNDAVFTINTKDDSIKTYDTAQPPSCVTDIFNKNGIIFGLVNCGDKLGKLIHNDASDSWNYVSLSAKEFGSLINLGLKDFGLDLPGYSYISNKVNGKYYLFSDKGVFTLEKNQFPQFYKNVSMQFSLDTTNNASIIYITKDEKYALFIGPQICGPVPVDQCSPLTGIIVDLTTGEVTDLLKNNADYRALTDENKLKLASEISLTTIEDNGSQLKLVNTQSKNDVFTINLLTKGVTLNVKY